MASKPMAACLVLLFVAGIISLIALSSGYNSPAGVEWAVENRPGNQGLNGEDIHQIGVMVGRHIKRQNFWSRFREIGSGGKSKRVVLGPKAGRILVLQMDTSGKPAAVRVFINCSDAKTLYSIRLVKTNEEWHEP